jgi:hydrocephalus-inducing protein
MCVAVPPSKEVVSFSTHVRNKDTKNIQIMNRTNQHWHLRPIIDGECWTGSDTFDVDPQTTKPYELTYHPLTMTSEGKKHSVRHSSPTDPSLQSLCTSGHCLLPAT